MRLAYTENPPTFDDAEEQAILKRVITRRGSNGLIALDRTLLHAPMIADGWNAFMIAIRTRNSLPADIRELAFCRVAALTKAWYEWEIHAPIATDAGLSDKAMAVIKDGKMAHWLLAQNVLTDKQLAVLRYADAMTLLTRVPEDVWRGARVHFDDKGMVELTASIAGFNTVARFVTALDVGEMNGQGTVLQE